MNKIREWLSGNNPRWVTIGLLSGLLLLMGVAMLEYVPALFGLCGLFAVVWIMKLWEKGAE